MTTNEILTGLAELLGTTTEAAESALRVALRQSKSETAQARVEFARGLSASLLQADWEAIEAERQRVIAPLEAAYATRSGAHAGLIGRLSAIVAEGGDPPSEAEIRAELEA